MSADLLPDPASHPEAAADEVHGIALDPFGYVPSQISRIIGLGGGEPGFDPYYAFHTPYTDCGVGPILFALQFQGLVATKGTLTLQIHKFRDEPGCGVAVAATSQANLRDLAVTEEPIMLRIVAEAGTIYAIFGTIYDDTDARATRLTVTLDERGDDSPHAIRVAQAARTAFGAPSIHSVSHLVSRETATLADPVCQMCTIAQTAEPVYAEWANILRMPGEASRKQWEFIYILQTLRRYGMLEPGACGVGFGVGGEPLPAIMANMGCTIVATDLPPEDERTRAWSATREHGDILAALRRPDLCRDDAFDALVSCRDVDMMEIPGDLRGFDFVWSSGALEHLGSVGAGIQFVEDAMRCLKPGGLAVHTTQLDLRANVETMDDGETALFRRRDIERLALSLISRGHEVAQAKFDPGERPLDEPGDATPSGPLTTSLGNSMTTSFGMIVRRGLR